MGDEDTVSAENPPDVRTLRWLAAKVTEDALDVKERFPLLTTGTDRVSAKAQFATLMRVAELCQGTADAIEEERKAREGSRIILTDGPIT